MADAKDVNGVASDLEEDTVNFPPLAVKELAKLPGIPFAFGSKPPPLRAIFQGADGLHELLMPPSCGRAGPPGEPVQRVVDFAQRPGGDLDRIGHRITCPFG